MLLSVGYEVRAYLEGLEVGWWWQAVLRYGGGELCYVWWGFVEGFEVFFFFFPSFVKVFVFGICWRTSGYSSGCCGGGSWLVVTARVVCLYIVGF